MQRILVEDHGVWINVFEDGRVQIGSYSGRPTVRYIANGGKSDPPTYTTVEVTYPPQTKGSKRPRRRSTDWAV